MTCRESRILLQGEIKKINTELEKINEKLEKLDESITVTDGCVVDIFGLEERLEDKFDRLEKEFQVKSDCLEEELTAGKGENKELKSHLNSVIKEVNSITGLLNEKYGNLIEKTYELDR